MKTGTRFLASICAAALVTLTGIAPAKAAAWPAKPVKLLVGFAPGGPTDVVARILAEEMSRNLGQPIIVENKAGAAGNLKPLAITSKTRSPVMPDVPTVDESLIPGFESLAWQGIVAPAGTPADVVETLNKAIAKALQSDTVKEKLAQQGTIILGGSAAEYDAYIRSEYKRWGEVVKASGAQHVN